MRGKERKAAAVSIELEALLSRVRCVTATLILLRMQFFLTKDEHID